MFLPAEGEVVLKEKYGASTREILYTKPPGQASIVILDNNRFKDITSSLLRIFLPQGYPESVSKDYMQYQIWDTAQAFCSTITGILATQEVLRGVGVGDTEATPLAATITWVIKDGCGHIGKILFAYTHGSSLDAYSKKWRLYADVLNDAAMCLEIALPLFRKKYTTLILCTSTVMKAIVGVAGGATRAALTQHHATRGNMADVAARDSAQETAVNLVASLAALLVINTVGNSLIIFMVMMMLHIMCNYMAVRAVCLRTLNEPRFLQTIDLYLRHEEIASPCKINRLEPIIFYQMGSNILDLKICGFYIKLGCSIKEFVRDNSNYSYVKAMKDMYGGRKHIMIPNIDNRTMYIVLKEGASTDDILYAYFNAVLLSIIVCAVNGDALSVYEDMIDQRPFAQVCRTLQQVGWSRESSRVSSQSTTGFKYKPSEELIKYVDKISHTEWLRIRNGLLATGWDLSKHLLLMDEWRVVNDPSPNVVDNATLPSDNEDDVHGSQHQSPTLYNTFQELDEHFNFDKGNLARSVIEPDGAKCEKID